MPTPGGVRPDDCEEMRSIAPVFGVALLIALTVGLAAVVAVGLGAISIGGVGPTATFELTVDAAGDRIGIEHVAGDELDAAELDLLVRVNDEPLEDQPPIPFFAADGFESGPTGAFNPSGGTEWRAGESAEFALASTNEPTIEDGDVVEVAISHDDRTIDTVEATAR